MTTTATAERALNMLDPKRLYQREGHNPRGEVDRTSEAYKELVSSIEEHGVLQSILAGPPDDQGYPVIAGHRRHLAALDAGVTEVPVVVAGLNGDGSAFTAAVVENIVREDLTPVQEAHALKRLRDDLGMTQKAAADALGKSERWARERQKILNLPDSVQKAIAAEEVPTEAVGMLEKIAKVSPAACEQLVQRVLEGKTEYEGSDLADPVAVAKALRGVAKTKGLGLQLVTSSWGGSAEIAVSGLIVSSEQRKELKTEVDAMPKRSWGHHAFEFDKADQERARKEGKALQLSHTSYGQTTTDVYITDPDLVYEMAKAKLPAMRESAEKHAERYNRTSGNNADFEEQRRKEAEKREKERKQFEEANGELVERLNAMPNPRATDVEVVRTVCAMALGWDVDDYAAEGLGKIGLERYQWPEGDDEGERLSPGDAVLEDLANAKTAGECLKVVLRAAVASQHQQGGGFGGVGVPGPEPGSRLDVVELLDDAAEQLDLLPKVQQREVAKRRKEREARRKEAAKRSGANV